MENEDYDECLRALQEKESQMGLNPFNSANSMFEPHQDPNLIEYQLELDNILERIEHLLRGDVLATDETGNVIYTEAKDNNNKVFNEYGVQFLMNVMSFYINKNTLLSNYTPERINQILYDVGMELTDQIYLSYEEMGLDTPEKIKRFPLIVQELIHTIESAYNRAISGGERESLRTARMVTQSADNYQQPMPQTPQPKKSMFKPSTWGLK